MWGRGPALWKTQLKKKKNQTHKLLVAPAYRCALPLSAECWTSSFLSLCLSIFMIPSHKVHAEWRLPIYRVHPIMMEKSALAGECGRCTPTHFQPLAITFKLLSCSEHSCWEGRYSYTLSISSLPYMYSVVPGPGGVGQPEDEERSESSINNLQLQTSPVRNGNRSW
jgi:hypothetical protein